MYVNIKNSSKELQRMLDRDGAVNQLEKDIQEVKESLENVDAKKSWSENNPDSPKYIEDRTHWKREADESLNNALFLVATPATLEEDGIQSPYGIYIKPKTLYQIKIEISFKDEIVSIYENSMISDSELLFGHVCIGTSSDWELTEYDWSDCPIRFSVYTNVHRSEMDYSIHISDDLIYDKISIYISGDAKIINFTQLDTAYIPNAIARKEDLKWGVLKDKPFYIENKATFFTEGDKIIAVFEKPLNAGEQLWYSYNVPGVGTVKASSKGIAVWSSDTTKYRVSIGNKEMTDYGMMGYSTIGTNIMEISYASANNYGLPEFESLMVVKPIDKEFLNTNKNINAGFNSIVDEASVSANNFGTSNVLSGDNSTTFGNSNKVQGKLSTVFGQNNTVIGNLSMLIGEQGNINGRNSFGVGQQIKINGNFGFGFGYNLSVSDNQFVIGDNNVADTDAVFIVGKSGKNVFTIKNNGKIMLGEKELSSITAEERTQLASFESTGYDNTNTGKGSVQLGVKNNNVKDNVVQIGRENTTQNAAGGYIYQIGYKNISQQAHSYLFGKELIGFDWEQVVIGKYNKESTALLVIGNGTSSNRANALEIFKNNDAKFAGDVYSKNKILATKDYVDNSRTHYTEPNKVIIDTILKGEDWEHIPIVPSKLAAWDNVHVYLDEVEQESNILYSDVENMVMLSFGNGCQIQYYGGSETGVMNYGHVTGNLKITCDYVKTLDKKYMSEEYASKHEMQQLIWRIEQLESMLQNAGISVTSEE